MLSTSWVSVLGFKRAKARLPVSLQAQVIGATWHSSFKCDSETLEWWSGATRYQQIMRYVLRGQVSDWLDDSGEGWDAGDKRLVLCDSDFGLSEAAVRDRLAACLQAMCGGALPSYTRGKNAMTSKFRTVPHIRSRLRRSRSASTTVASA